MPSKPSGGWQGERGSRHERGYGAQWDRLRKTILQRDRYLCQPCERIGRTTPAREVDHIVPKAKGGEDDEANLQAICLPCHIAKTKAEAKQAQNGETRRMIGADGWPVNDGMIPCTLVCGPPGAGKSHYVAKHMQDGDIVVDLDEIIRALTLKDTRTARRHVLPFAMAARNAVIASIKSGTMGPGRAWVIVTGDDNTDRRTLASSINANVVAIATPARQCIEQMRAQGRSSAAIAKVADVCARWHAQFKPMAGDVVIAADPRGVVDL